MTKRLKGKRRSKKTTKNLSMAARLIEFTEVYCDKNGRTVSSLVEDLLRRFYETKGIDIDAPMTEIVAAMKKKKAPKEKDDPPSTKRFIPNNSGAER